MKYIFGPVPSRRLGLSLGVDLVPAKTCTYDCLYCQVGRTTDLTVETRPYVPINDVIEEVKERLEQITPDVITFSGSGEPTLHSEIDQAISAIKAATHVNTAVLTNGSLLWRDDVRSRLLEADIIVPTLSTVNERTFRAIHRPHKDFTLRRIIEGLEGLRTVYRGLIYLEVVLLAGLNDTDEEIDELRRVIGEISPNKVQLNTVVRPPADPRALALDRKRLEDIKNFLGPETEIIADLQWKQIDGFSGSAMARILEMVVRRPLRAVDVSNALQLPLDEIEGYIKGLVVKGAIRPKRQGEDVYYVAKMSE